MNTIIKVSSTHGYENCCRQAGIQGVFMAEFSDLARGYILGFIGVAIFGATLPATRLAVEIFDPWFITAARAAIAGVAAAICLIVMGKALPRKAVPSLTVIALCLVFGFPGFSSLAMVTVPASHGGVVLGILPLATAVAAVLVAGERPAVRFWVLALGGAGLVVAFSLRKGGFSISAGDWWLFAAGASAALGYALSGRLARTIPGWEVISWALVLCLPLNFAASWLLWEPVYAGANQVQWLSLGYLGLFSMFLGFFAWNTGLALGGVAQVGQVQLLQTFITLAVSAVLLGEHIDSEMLFFAAAVVAIVAQGRRGKN
jgi:drug/metabolite transporter (DMT)-like permease